MPAWASTPRAADIRSWLRRTSRAWHAVKASPKSGVACRRLPVSWATPGGGLYVAWTQAGLESPSSAFPGVSRVPDVGQGPR
jgi:hypothetical protein